jgi:predicted permease
VGVKSPSEVVKRKLLVDYLIAWRFFMEYSKVFNQVVILFIIMIIGFFARRKNIINKEVNKGLTELVLNIRFPFMVIASFNFKYSHEMMASGGKILLISICIHLILILIGGIIFKKYPENMKGVLRFVIVFSNCGFMGYPVIDSVYGKTGVFYASIYNSHF